MSDITIYFQENASAIEYELQVSADYGETWTTIYKGTNLSYKITDAENGEYQYRYRYIGNGTTILDSDWKQVQVNVGARHTPMSVVDLLEGETMLDNTYTSADNSTGSSSTWRTYNSVDVSDYSSQSYLICFYGGIFNNSVSDTVVPIVAVKEDDSTMKLLELITPNSSTHDYYYVIVPQGVKFLSFTSKKLSGRSMSAEAYFGIDVIKSNFTQNITTELLPLKAMGTSIANSTNSHQSNVFVTADGDIYIALIGDDTYLRILQKRVGEDWETYSFNGALVNPFGTTSRDAHMHYSIAVSSSGKIVVSGNMHNSPCKAVISVNANDISEWQAIDYSGGQLQISYPTFLLDKEDNLYAFWRNGGSSNGRYFYSKFNPITELFENVTSLISDSVFGVYVNKIAVTDDNEIMIAFGYRNEAGSAETNSGIWFIKSDDGVNWGSMSGTPITLPASSLNSELVYQVAEGDGMVNQNSCCVDNKGIFHLVYWLRDQNNKTQIIHSWYSKGVWSTERLTQFLINIDLSSGGLDGRMLRPQIAYFPSVDKVLAFCNTQEYESKGKVTFVDVQTKEVFTKSGLTIGNCELEGFYHEGKYYFIHGNLSTTNAPEFTSVDMWLSIIE